MNEKLKKIWDEIPPERKRIASISLVVVAVIFIGIVGYYFSHSGEPTVSERKVPEKKEITLEPGILEKSLYREQVRKIEELKKELERLKKQRFEEMEKIKKAKVEESEVGGTVKGSEGQIKFPPPPPPPPQTQQFYPEQQKEGEKKKTVVLVGDIGIVKSPPKEQKKEQPQEVSKKNTIYLPPSFMEGTLLSGLAAPAMGQGSSNPVPVLIRVKDIAVLPNKVKANLKGCFVIADGVGSLADERVHLRLVSLSCVAKNGSAVIDQRVKGFVIDEDGKIGLSGRVVSKMGSAIARSFLAGLFGGFGDVLEQSTATTSVSPLGVTKSYGTTTKELAQAGVGKGLSSAAYEIQKFYLDLAKQAIPVIEVGSTKDVTIVISEGVDLEIKEANINKLRK